jgi:hypothetical protein
VSDPEHGYLRTGDAVELLTTPTLPLVVWCSGDGSPSRCACPPLRGCYWPRTTLTGASKAPRPPIRSSSTLLAVISQQAHDAAGGH